MNQEQANRRASTSLSPILYLFFVPSGKLYLKVKQLLSHVETLDGSPPIVGKRRSGSKHLNYGIPAEHWPMVIHRVVENNEPLRKVVDKYGVSHETIRYIMLHIQKQDG